ncbi:hypothetical protein SAMN05444920_104769 [Nonomuraea solani]|uniref:Uncharacterized protein n=1 Tax=Nonomuraea solani TaxID=1144553 RepID=A0A1H6D4M6_9ACTN|nr:hypothetical protein [Nonomuraea solani]SEG79918.1 hypothetical protein SAMN05444920_104769 [Nonomuraea solani]
MDASVISALAVVVSAIIGGAAGEAGKGAWTSLTTLVRRRFGSDAQAVATLEQFNTHSPEEITKVLVGHANADSEFEVALTEWTNDTIRLIRHTHDVSNSIGGEARISGPVIQAGDVQGSINFGKS